MRSVIESKAYTAEILDHATNYQAADENVCAAVCWALGADPEQYPPLGQTDIRVVKTTPSIGMPVFLAHYFRIEPDGTVLLLSAVRFEPYGEEEDAT